MSNDLIHKCCICTQDFRPEGLDKDGKCTVCRVEHPTAKNMKEVMALTRPEIHLGKKLDAEEVRQIVKEELNEFRAEQVAMTKALGAAAKIDNMAKARAAKQDKKDDSKGDE